MSKQSKESRRLRRARIKIRTESTDPIYSDANISILDPISMHGVLVRTCVQVDTYEQIKEQGLLSTNAQVALGMVPKRRPILPNVVFFRAPKTPVFEDEVPATLPARTLKERIRAEVDAAYDFRGKENTMVYIRVDPDNTRVFFSEINSKVRQDDSIRRPSFPRGSNPDRSDNEYRQQRERVALDMHKRCTLTLSDYMELIKRQERMKQERIKTYRPHERLYWNLARNGDLEAFDKPPGPPWDPHDININSEIWAQYRVDPSYFVIV